MEKNIITKLIADSLKLNMEAVGNTLSLRTAERDQQA